MEQPPQVPVTEAVIPAVKPAEPTVKIADFKNFKLVVAQIKEAKNHPNADKLYVLQVDTGSDVRQVVAGIRLAYTPEQLVGRRVILIANLEPATIRGEVSNGMLLAATDATGLCLVGLEREMVLGSAVK